MINRVHHLNISLRKSGDFRKNQGIDSKINKLEFIISESDILEFRFDKFLQLGIQVQILLNEILFKFLGFV